MKRSKLNFIIDAAGFLGFILLTTTGVLMRYILPPGSGHHSTIWNLDRHEWGDIHFWISIIFFSLLTFHLFLHWQWIKCVFMGQPRQGSGFRAGLGTVGLITVLALALSPLLAPVENDSADRKKSSLSDHQYENISIRGSMTLNEVEKKTNVPANYIINSLKLPQSVSKEEKLASLKKRYGFELAEVRQVINRYQKRK